MRIAWRVAVVLSALALGACGGEGENEDEDEGGATMRPGEDCIACHGSFTAAGTVFSGTTSGAGVSGASVTITGTRSTVTLNTNSAGNFYTKQDLGFPATIQVSHNGVTSTMSTPASSGACNSCHDSSQRVHP